ncbi:hypothetical protein P9239_17360 [Caballeronia sp. LZ062]|uniref:hypothetical protein n=1 Tax=unclassified Caballeronia TaxID=2646786 RepID=UPI002864A243|nr:MULTISPECIES: hypothetical protein [unclassified Caballeronia]MDR5853349.1 hypothetical protein [Caballeronia sp. LZ050]MDR5872116.1 hypothetical protein [Caballeronia sp. LZ062]
MKRRKVATVLLGVAALLSLWFYLGVGYYYSSIDHEEHAVYFIKKGLTRERAFINPFANEGDPSPVNRLSPQVRSDLAVLCKYAYGIEHYDNRSLEDCRTRIIEDVQ